MFMFQKYELCGWTEFLKDISTQKKGEEIKTDVAGQAIYIYTSQFRLFIVIWILWATTLEITVHSSKRNPFAFQLLYSGMTFASTSLT